jgi:hypothetical protein
MLDVTAKSHRTTRQRTEGRGIPSANRPLSPALDDRYGRIGISAVAAAARYQGAAKNPAYAPAPTDWRDQYAEKAV